MILRICYELKLLLIRVYALNENNVADLAYLNKFLKNEKSFLKAVVFDSSFLTISILTADRPYAIFRGFL
jgi:hypothetical protein